MMMMNYSLKELYIWGNNFGDDGIYAIAEALGSCKIHKLNIESCGITLTGARSLAEALSSNLTVKGLWLLDNSITLEGALLIVNSAVHNPVCQDVKFNDEYMSDEIQKMLNILEDRKRQEVRDCVIYILIPCDYFNVSMNHYNLILQKDYAEKSNSRYG